MAGFCQLVHRNSPSEADNPQKLDMAIYAVDPLFVDKVAVIGQKRNARRKQPELVQLGMWELLPSLPPKMQGLAGQYKWCVHGDFR